MSDRKDSYFLQLVDEAFFDACFDDMEAADRLLAVDLGFIGVTSGLVVSEHVAPPDLTVDVTAGVSYDQAGRRCGVTSGVSALNCAVDENAVATTVAGAPNERWISIQIRFDRTLADLQVDGNGNNVWVDQDESYELAVVAAGEFVIGTNTKPALPTDGRLLCDIQLINAQTQIFNADVDITRRQDFSVFSAGAIPVTSGAWTFLNPATDDVQSVFDFIDDYSLVTNSATELLQHIIPSVAGRNLGEVGKEWDLYLGEMVTIAASRVDGHLIPKTTGNDLGASAGPLRWSLYSDFIDLLGNIKTDASTRVDGHLIPLAAANDLGSAALPWDLYLRTLTTDGSSRITGNLLPTASSQDLGSTGLRWDLFSEIITSYHATYTGAFIFDSGKAVSRYLDIMALGQLAWTTSTWLWQGPAVLGGRTITGWTYSASGATTGDIKLDLPNGVTLNDLALSWYQTAAGAALTAELFSVDAKGSETSKGSFTISGSAAWKDDEAMGLVDFVIDRSVYNYILRLTGVASQDCFFTGVLFTGTVTDLGKAAV